MKKKGILIGVLAVLMLVAFTACEQNPSTPLYGAQVESVTVAEQPVYMIIPAGLGVQDTIDPSVIKFAVKYNDGKVYTYTGAQLGLEASDVEGGATVDAATKTIKVSLDEDGKYVFYTQVKAFAPTSAVIDLSSVKDQPLLIQKGQDVKYDAKVNVSADSAAKEFTFEITTTDDEIAKIIDDNDLDVGDTFEVSADYATTIASKNLVDNPFIDVTFTGKLAVKVVDGTESKIADITPKQGAAIYAALEGMTGGNTTLKQAAISVEAFDKDGNKLSGTDVEGFAIYVYDNKGVKMNDAYTWKESGSYDVTVKYAKGDVSFEKAFKIVVSDDYPTAYSVKQVASEALDPVTNKPTKVHQFILGEDITTTGFEFTPTAWKSTAKYGDDVEPEFEMPSWKANPGKIPTDVTLNGTEGEKTGTYTPSFEAVVDGELATATWTGSAVPVVQKVDYTK